MNVYQLSNYTRFTFSQVFVIVVDPLVESENANVVNALIFPVVVTYSVTADCSCKKTCADFYLYHTYLVFASDIGQNCLKRPTGTFSSASMSACRRGTVYRLSSLSLLQPSSARRSPS